MKITEIRTIPLNFKEPRYERDALAVKAGAEHPMDVLVVEVVTDEGISGIGEIFAYNASPLMEEVIRSQIAPLVLGRNPLEINNLWNTIYYATYRHGRRGAIVCALSGFDIALWDILGKVTGRSVSSLLGGGRESVPAYITGGYYAEDKDLDQLKDEVEVIKSRGFNGFKLKVGGASITADTRRLETVREAVGEDFMIGVDANCALSYTEALKLGRVLEDMKVTFFEEPISTDYPQLSSRLANDLDVPIAGYETALTRWEILPFMRDGGVDIVQTDAIWVGGISEARRVAEIAAGFGLEYIPHFSAGAIALVANLQLASAMPNSLFQEYHIRPNPLRDELVINPPKVVNGEIVVPTGPGLGVELNQDTIARYRLHDGLRLKLS